MSKAPPHTHTAKQGLLAHEVILPPGSVTSSSGGQRESDKTRQVRKCMWPWETAGPEEGTGSVVGTTTPTA